MFASMPMAACKHSSYSETLPTQTGVRNITMGHIPRLCWVMQGGVNESIYPMSIVMNDRTTCSHGSSHCLVYII